MSKPLLITDAIDENLKLIRDSDGTDTALELSKDKLKINGDLDVTGSYKGLVTVDSGVIQSDNDITLDSAGDITLDAGGGEISLFDGGSKFGKFSTGGSDTSLHLFEDGGASVNDYLVITVAADGDTSIATVDGGGTDADLVIKADGDLTFNSATGVFKAVKGLVEFSVAGSAYAGMILGATRIYDNAQQYIATTATFRVLLKNFDSADHNLGVTFIVPPSNRVKISVFLPFCSGLDGTFYLGLATDTDATTLDAKYEQRVWDVDETDAVGINYHWIVDGSDHSWSAGESKTLYAMMKEGTTGGRIYFGDGLANYGALVMEAIAYPTTIGDGT